MIAIWLCKTGGVEHGPYTSEQLAALVRERRVSAIDFVREGDAGEWQPAGQLPWLVFPPPTPAPSVAACQRPASPVWPWVLVSLAVMAAFGVFGLVVIVIAVSPAEPSVSSATVATGEPTPQATATAPSWPANEVAMPAEAIARIEVRGWDATEELQRYVLQLSEEQRALLGLAAFASGADVYAAEIRIANTGPLPVRVYPQNIAIHFGSEAARVTTSDHPRFLQASVLQPGEYVQGLVMYQARIDIGAAMRLGAGGFSYNDDSIHVEYAQ